MFRQGEESQPLICNCEFVFVYLPLPSRQSHVKYTEFFFRKYPASCQIALLRFDYGKCGNKYSLFGIYIEKTTGFAIAKDSNKRV